LHSTTGSIIARIHHASEAVHIQPKIFPRRSRNRKPATASRASCKLSEKYAYVGAALSADKRGISLNDATDGFGAREVAIGAPVF
jgi:hypothetical protein